MVFIQQPAAYTSTPGQVQNGQGQPWTYLMDKDSKGKFILTPIPDLYIDTKVYGKSSVYAKRIMDAYRDRKGVTGILLIGEKGSGKTLMLKILSQYAREYLGIPTVIVNQPFTGDDFNQFVQSMPPCMIGFEEFEKVYNRYGQQSALLTLYDGVFTTKKLMVHTANNQAGIDDHYINRPGRHFYRIEYRGLETEFIQEYCEDNLNDMSHVNEIIRIASLHRAFNFDMLKALVEEMNRFELSPREALEIMNIVAGDDISFSVSVLLDDGTQLTGREVMPNRIDGHPSRARNLSISYRKTMQAPPSGPVGAPPPPMMGGGTGTINIESDGDRFEMDKDSGGKIVRYHDPESKATVLFTRSDAKPYDLMSLLK